MSEARESAACARADLHDMLARYEFGALDTDERAAIEAHVLECDACFAELERGLDVVAVMRQHGTVLAAELRRNTPASGPTRRPPRAPTRLRSRFPHAWVLLPAAVAAAVGGIAVVHVVRSPTAAELATFPTEAPAPEILRAPGTPDAVAELIATGAAHFDLGHYAQAAERFRAALARDPSCVEAAYLAGLATALAGDARGAIPNLETAAGLATGEQRARASWVLANAYLRAGMRGASRRVLEELRTQGGEYGARATTLLERLGYVRGSTEHGSSRAGPIRLAGFAGGGHTDDALVAARRSFAAERWAEALERAREAATAAEKRGDATAEIDARLVAADCLFEQGLGQQAGAEFAAAGERAARTGDRARAAWAAEGTARVYQLRGEMRQAVPAFLAVVNTARELGDRDLECRGLIGLGQSYNLIGNRTRAAPVLEEALALARKRDDIVLETRAILDLALAMNRLGDHEKAFALVEQAVQLARRTGKKREVATALTRAGFLYIDYEQHSRALAAMSEALPLAQELGARRTIINIYGRRAQIYTNLGRLQEALIELQAARALAREMHAVRAEGGLLRRTGQVLSDLGRDDEANQAFDAALQITRTQRVPADEVDMLHVLGEFKMEHGQLAAAKTCLQEARATLDSLHNQQLGGHVDCLLGEIAFREGDRARAHRMCDEAIARSRGAGDRGGLREALRLEATLLRAEGDLAGADGRLQEAIEVSEAVRAGLAGSEHRVGFHDVSRPLYLDRVAVLYEIGGAARDEAFRVMEMARARVLLDALAGVRVEPDETVDPALRSKHAQCLKRLSAVQTELSRTESDAATAKTSVDSLLRAYEEASRALREVRQEISVRAPSYAALVGVAPPLGVRDVQERVLAPGQVLLEYLIGRDASHVCVLDAQGLRMHRLDIGDKSLQELVGGCRDAIVRDDRSAFTAASRRLYDVLVAPAVAGIDPNARLLIVPDGPLFELPFAALHDGRQFLVERYPIATTPSASALDPRLRREEQKPPARLLAVGNPASYREDALLASARAAHGWSFGELPYAEEEARRVGRYFSRKKILLRKDATEEAVKRQMRDAGVLHFATHGVIDASEPLLCGLVLAQDDDPREDGLLQVHEILGMRLDADLVVLSACGSGLGQRVGGEGVLGLTRAFLYTGARRLVFSLWEVADRSTVELMERFYTARFADRLPSDAALRAAQMQAIAAGGRPRDWAAFALAGAVEAAAPAAVSRR